MLKKKEMDDPASCLNKAKDDEPVFVLLGRDRAAIHAVMHWINVRKIMKLNSDSDAKLVEAFAWVEQAIKYQKSIGLPEDTDQSNT